MKVYDKIRSFILAMALLLTTFLFQGCDQGALGFVEALHNIVGGASDLLTSFHNFATGNTWAQYKEKTQEARRQASISPSRMCVALDHSSGQLSSLQVDMDHVRDRFCTCKAWGTCGKGNCSCDTLCPDNFEILNRGGQEMGPTDKEDFVIRNNAQDFAGVHNMTGGLCWGLAAMNSRFNHLAFFQPAKPKPTFPDAESRGRYYRYIVDSIRNNSPLDIDGFSNLKEFSSDTQIREILADVIGHEWGRQAISFQGISSISTSSPLDSEDAISLVNDLKYRTENFQTPSLLFNVKGDAAGSAHVVLVTEVRNGPNGTSILCIKDNAMAAITNNNCGNQMIVERSSGKITYKSTGNADEEVGFAQIAHNENSDVVSQINALRARCLADKSGCYRSIFQQETMDIPRDVF